jgi:putative flippase GtrA
MLKLLARFGLVGLANTALGFVVTMTMLFGLHLSPTVSNTIGYAVGICFSFLLSRGFVFKSNAGWETGVAYAVTVGIAFLINLGVLNAAHAVLGASKAMLIVAQLAGMVAYTVTNFLLCRYWVFAAAANASMAGQSASNT